VAAATLVLFAFFHLLDITLKWDWVVTLYILGWLAAAVLILAGVELGRLLVIFLSLLELAVNIILPLRYLDATVQELSITFGLTEEVMRNRILTGSLIQGVVLISFIIYFTHPKVKQKFSPLF